MTPATKRRHSNDMPTKQPFQKRRKNGIATDPVSTDPEEQFKSLKIYMHHALKLLHKSVKKSKTFELQKLTRKLKQARDSKDSSEVISSLEAQLLALKQNISLDILSHQILISRLPKIASLATHLPSLLPTIPSQPSPTTEELDPTSNIGKARNRVLANKVIHEGWEDISRGIRKRLGEEIEAKVEAKKEKGKEKAKPAPSTGSSKDRVLTEVNEDEVAALIAAVEGGEKRLSKRAERKLKGQMKANRKPGDMPINPERLKAMKRSDDLDEEDAGSEDDISEIDDDEEIRRELEALGGGGGSDWSGSEDEAGSADDQGGQGSENDDDDDVGTVASDSSFPSSSKPKATAKASSSLTKAKPEKEVSKKKKESTLSKITSSAFLPTLASGYVSYSDSDGEDAKWIKQGEKEDKKEEKRKNRRGQRARQAIWEKKYGSGANHVVKNIGGVPAPQKGGKASSKKAQTKASLDATASTKPYDPSQAPDASRNSNAEPVGYRKVVRPTISYAKMTPIVPMDLAKVSSVSKPPAPEAAQRTRPLVEEGMHPSWEAKRRAQEALLNLANAPKGKKITFD